LHGGVVIASGEHVVNVPIALNPVFVMWVPEFTTSTNESRGKIGPSIALTDAVFNIAHTAMFVTALQTGDISLLREATKDRILDAGAWCGWLSGSGPTVALMCDPTMADTVAAALPADGHAKKLTIDFDGAVTL
jgi:homoserine kinase